MDAVVVPCHRQPKLFASSSASCRHWPPRSGGLLLRNGGIRHQQFISWSIRWAYAIMLLIIIATTADSRALHQLDDDLIKQQGGEGRSQPAASSLGPTATPFVVERGDNKQQLILTACVQASAAPFVYPKNKHHPELTDEEDSFVVLPLREFVSWYHGLDVDLIVAITARFAPASPLFFNNSAHHTTGRIISRVATAGGSSQQQ
eukprot:scaffold569514_cov45-Prasinocladus_malaysianus.AAC.1